MEAREAQYLQRARDLRHLLNGEWIFDIFVVLHRGPLRYSQLQSMLQDSSEVDPWSGAPRNIQSRVLGRTLRRLEEARLIHRKEELGAFPRVVVYSLTAEAVALITKAMPMIRWAEDHADLIEHAQQLQQEQRRSLDRKSA